jgi:hypothetical protein
MLNNAQNFRRIAARVAFAVIAVAAPQAQAEAQFFRDPFGTIGRCINMGPSGCANKTVQTGIAPIPVVGPVAAGAAQIALAPMTASPQTLFRGLQQVANGQVDILSLGQGYVGTQVQQNVWGMRTAGAFRSYEECRSVVLAAATSAAGFAMYKTGNPMAAQAAGDAVYFPGEQACR